MAKSKSTRAQGRKPTPVSVEALNVARRLDALPHRFRRVFARLVVALVAEAERGTDELARRIGHLRVGPEMDVQRFCTRMEAALAGCPEARS
jgi:hypothetical protein